MLALAIHGGAGGVPRDRINPELERAFREGLSAALDAGYELLERGSSSLDAVESAVRRLEDDPLFNAGRGAVLTRDGWAELDAAIMDGRQQRAGAVACVRHVRNPVQLARRVMEGSRHVLLVGEGAEEFALDQGMTLVANEYFRTPERAQQLRRQLAGETTSELLPPHGTVGAVALDADGNLAAATSTGGMTLKRHGRVGDSPLIGAGTFAKNGVCALSGTGHGEYFIRTVAAHHVAMSVEYRGLGLESAMRELLHEKLRALGGDGGMIGVDGAGRIVMDFSTTTMFRGARDARGRREIAVF
ncbi:MAG TPA: isoaspartyl peptidase/L-asparaginase [Steroidobacteraceae bacterium]|nr:isoaspartyl peptidase/L-asparaginase [Steroidobacteraceae bacterium]